MRLIFIRHPQTQANAARVIYGRTESDYSPQGKQSIPGIVARLEGIRPDRIYASPLKRTAYLAQRIAERHGVEKILFEDRLLEMNFGIFENKTLEEVRAIPGEHYEKLMADYNHYTVPGGESFCQVQARVKEFLDELWSEKAEEAGTYIIVAHSMVIRGALSHLLEIPLDAIWHLRIEPGAVVDVAYDCNYGMLQGLYLPEMELERKHRGL